eukprot:TRINITY_DN2798_c0_g1_i1.p1 TRINITY_DN2798_c0_g1~~TRINITY_DN2798_c0_g1_i1.p1  ORF type:complete len:448 (-),score=125.54 TRINITY_DN2798_c0_g1_i1:82-1389(-)
MKREYDVVVFGASGFTGEFVATEWWKKNKLGKYSWAIAGRSEARLNDALKSIKARLAKEGLSEDDLKTEVGLIVADVKDEASIARMCAKTRLVLNCVGPYRFFGEAVVKACVANGTHYLDISGEPQFMEEMVLKYNTAAEEAGVIIVSACGFDSVPADLGFLFCVQECKKRNAVCNSVESYLNLKGGAHGAHGNFATYECVVHGYSDINSLKYIRKQLEQKNTVKPVPVGKKLQRYQSMFLSPQEKKYSYLFPGADASVVKRSLQTFLERDSRQGAGSQSPQYSAYISFASLFYAFLFLFFGSIFQFFAKFDMGRKLLLRYPEVFSFGVFSQQRPKEEYLPESSFEMNMFVEAYSNELVQAQKDLSSVKPDVSFKASVKGPEPGYIATPIIIVAAAVCLLESKTNGKGVLTPAVAFEKSDLIARLQENGVTFNLL